MAQLKSALQSSVSLSHDIDPFLSSATATAPAGKKKKKKKRFSGATVNVTGCGNDTNASSRDAEFFHDHFQHHQAKGDAAARSPSI